jgi:hypothetical protein
MGKSLENGKAMGILWEIYGENMKIWEFFGKLGGFFLEIWEDQWENRKRWDNFWEIYGEFYG